jgi:RNA polymerase sigma-70 factor (ECF subfamily)
MSYEEIAEVTGSTASAAKSNYHLAKERIVEYLRSND